MGTECDKCPRCGGEDFKCPCWHRQPPSYVLQIACVNCKHCFCKEEYDCGPLYYCTFGAPERPASGSVLMDEYPSIEDIDKQYQAWDDWERGREVKPHGYCDEYEPAPEPTGATE